MNYIQSIQATGSTGSLIQVECQLSNGLPSIVIVGLGNKAIDEAKERVRSAFASTGIQLPRKRITINLAPADLPKQSANLDLAIALAIMKVSKQVDNIPSECAVTGEVGLNGDVRPVRGIIGQLVAGKRLGLKRFIVPFDNQAQALLVPNVEVIPIKNIKELLRLQLLRPGTPEKYLPNRLTPSTSLSEISGQLKAKRALVIAAAGGHNILLVGAPGTGKSMLAKALPSIMPPLEHEEILEVTHLHSLTTHSYDRLVTERPFRSPHHGSSHTAIIGGGTMSRPGEVTLSHRGVLFMDELPEFSRATLEALRQPLEDRVVSVTRVRQSIEYPADFTLIATANPCPCGYYGTTKNCECTPGQVQRYKQKLSGPILDRIDLHISVNLVEHDKLLLPSQELEDTQARENVERARIKQYRRFEGTRRTNASLTSKEIRQVASLAAGAVTLLNEAAAKFDISARSYVRILKVARTIADIEGSEHVESHHISEALQYRQTDSESA